MSILELDSIYGLFIIVEGDKIDNSLDKTGNYRYRKKIPLVVVFFYLSTWHFYTG